MVPQYPQGILTLLTLNIANNQIHDIHPFKPSKEDWSCSSVPSGGPSEAPKGSVCLLTASVDFTVEKNYFWFPWLFSFKVFWGSGKCLKGP